MRTIKFLSILFFIVLTTSCTNDDMTSIDTDAQENDLVGTWNLSEESQDGNVNGVFGGISLSGDITSNGKDFNTQLTFTQDPNNFNASGNFADVIKVSAATITLYEGELVVPINDFITQGSWSVNEGILTLTQNNVNVDIRITELSATNLKVEFDIEDYDVNYEGNTGTVNSTIKMTFTKQ